MQRLEMALQHFEQDQASHRHSISWLLGAKWASSSGADIATHLQQAGAMLQLEAAMLQQNMGCDIKHPQSQQAAAIMMLQRGNSAGVR